MGLYRRLLCREVARQAPASELQRLLMLENAVLNYGGGLAILQGRVEDQASRLPGSGDGVKGCCPLSAGRGRGRLSRYPGYQGISAG
nr:hypothetical protein [Pantoea sp. 201603H]